MGPPQIPPWVQSLLEKLPEWAQSLITTLLGSVGGFGLFAIAFFDSSFGTLPVINDALVIALSLANPENMIFYATMASLGSILGCLTIFYMARKGGEAVLRRQKHATPERIERIRRWYERNEFLTVAIPAVLPPPTPFKVFILAAGVFGVRLRPFLIALTLGRGLRYFFWGFLAVWKGEEAVEFLRTHFLQVSAAAVGVILVIYVTLRIVQRYRARRRVQPS
ncbi:MAG: VTT domain-containing protein [Candidatus Acidoferrales bacterium]